MTLLIYGANGYTGELVARRAAGRQLPFVLAGRRAAPLIALGDELARPHRIFALDDPDVLARALDGITVVLNCAGPFSRTAAPWLSACLHRGVHYLDVTGEIAVLEAVAARDADAKARGITLLPGAGFDVVPSDCLAAEAKHRLPSADHLALAFQLDAQMSRGTATTTIENAHSGGLIRRAGVIVKVPSGWRTRSVDFGHGPSRVISIPWGDVATAFHTTGIPNIEVYVSLPAASRVGIRMARWLGPILASNALQRFLIARVRSGASGPNESERAQRESLLWAEATDAQGGRVRLRMRAPEAYELTSWTALELAERAGRGELPTGFQTPARACGRDFILQFPGVILETIP